MLDGVGAGADGAHHALGGGGVDGDQAAGVMRRGDARIELGLGQGGPARLALAPMIIGVEFDDVRARRDLVANRADRLVDPGDFLRALRALRRPARSPWAVGAARDDRPGRDEQARAGDDALVDRLLEADVGKAGAFGAEVALGGEAGIERALGVDDRARGAQRERLVQHLIVPQGLVVGMEEEVRMALDHPGHAGSRPADR